VRERGVADRAQRGCLERHVARPSGVLERSLGRLDRAAVATLEPDGVEVDRGRELVVACRVLERLLDESLRLRAVALVARKRGELPERLGLGMLGCGVGERLLEQSSLPVGVSDRARAGRCVEPSPVDRCPSVGRRERDGLLGELGRCARGAACKRCFRRGLERGRYILVRCFGRERQVAGALLGVVDELR
jgi:hypothetical protein